jgi:pimeloyl-ACP methyl ester carboxylesterase
MSTPIHYARSGDVHVAYQVVGDGPIDLVMAMGSFTNLEVLWELSEYRRLCENLGSFARLLLFDKRGMGRSWACPKADRCRSCSRRRIRSARAP